MHLKQLKTIIISFILILLVLIPPFASTDEPIDPPPDGDAYHYWYAPENSFGIKETKSVNWSYFRELFLSHIDWMLEARINNGEWFNADEYLTIERTWNESGFWKFNLIFDKPAGSPMVDARFTFGIDLPCLQYVEREGYEVWINYTANATETYSIMFNWSDIASIPGLVITRGRTDNMFWFRFRRDNIPAGLQHYEFDPTFGEEGAGSTIKDLDEERKAAGHFLCSDSGVVNNLSIRLNAYSGTSNVNATGAIYHYNGTLLAQTEVFTGGGDSDYDESFKVFDFVIEPSVTAGNRYWLFVRGASDGGVFGFYETDSIGNYYWYDDEETWDPVVPSVIDDVIEFPAWNTSDHVVNIYATVTVDTAPILSGEIPADTSTDIIRWPQLNITVTDPDGTNSEVYWYTNASGSWYLMQTNSTVLNSTIRLMNFTNASSYSTKYWWRVSANDTQDNTTEIYHFTTTSEFWINTAPSFSNPVPTNGSSGISRQPTVNVTITDVDGNQSTCNFYNSTNGVDWTWRQTNATILNESIEYDYTQASSYSTLYYWKVTANDTHDNSSVIYHFTTEADPTADTDYYVKNGGDDAKDGLSDANAWETVTKVTDELKVTGIINAGDDIYFKRGDSWIDTDMYLRTGGESEANPMIIGAYGTGERPRLNSSNNVMEPYVADLHDIIIENLIFHSTGSNVGFGINDAQAPNFSRLILRNIEAYGCTNGIILKCVDDYFLENCNTHNNSNCGTVIHGSIATPIQNGRIWNCTSNDNSNDGIQIHDGRNDDHNAGLNHWIKNCTVEGNGEDGFDISSGGNIYVEDCISKDTGNKFGTGHAVVNVTLDNFWGYDTAAPYAGNGYLGLWNNNSIVRFSTFDGWHASTDAGVQYGSGGTTEWVSNSCFYNNNIIYDSNCDPALLTFKETGYISNINFKNNIFLSTEDALPNHFAVLGASLDATTTNFANNMWWRGDGGSGDDTWWSQGGGNLNLAQWNALTRVSGELVDDPELNDVANYDYDLNATSPCIDAGNWLTQTDGSGTDTDWVTVDEANYFFDGYDIVGLTGDNIFVGTDTDLVIIEMNYANNSFQVNRSITWGDDEHVSLSAYNGSAPDIGAIEASEGDVGAGHPDGYFYFEVEPPYQYCLVVSYGGTWHYYQMS